MNNIILRGYKGNDIVTRGFSVMAFWSKLISGVSRMKDITGNSRMTDISGISRMVQELKNYDS